MKAVVITSYGDSSVLQLDDVPTPVPDNDQVLVKVHAIGVNPIELVARSGGFDWPVPVIIGFEFAGTVEAIGESVTGVRIGDRAAGWPDSPVHGSYAEYTLSSNYTRIPESVGFERAAATVIGADNAARGLALLRLTEGETLVVTGASGALGSAAVQFARRTGATVIGIAGPSSLAFVEGLGAIAVEYGDNLVEASAGRTSYHPVDARSSVGQRSGEGMVATSLLGRDGVLRRSTGSSPREWCSAA